MPSASTASNGLARRHANRANAVPDGRGPVLTSAKRGMAGDERRAHQRMSLRLPVRAQGYDIDGTPWVEMTTSVDASTGGTSLDLRHAVRVGQILHLQMPLPRRFRSFDPYSPSYRVYA